MTWHSAFRSAIVAQKKIPCVDRWHVRRVTSFIYATSPHVTSIPPPHYSSPPSALAAHCALKYNSDRTKKG